MTPLRERFEAKILKAEGCWGWRGAHFKQTGYCVFNVKRADGKWAPTTAHRIAYQLYVGEIPEGYWIDHRVCQNHGCVNPAHLEAVPPAVNTARGNAPSAVAVRENRCARGHSLADAIVRPSGKRECRPCAQARDRARTGTEARRAHYRAVYRRRKAARQGVMP